VFEEVNALSWFQESCWLTRRCSYQSNSSGMLLGLPAEGYQESNYWIASLIICSSGTWQLCNALPLLITNYKLGSCRTEQTGITLRFQAVRFTYGPYNELRSMIVANISANILKSVLNMKRW